MARQKSGFALEGAEQLLDKPNAQDRLRRVAALEMLNKNRTYVDKQTEQNGIKSAAQFVGQNQGDLLINVCKGEPGTSGD